MHATHRIDVKNVITDAALEQAKLSWRSSSSRYHLESLSGSEHHEKFLKHENIKHFIFSKDTVLSVI